MKNLCLYNISLCVVKCLLIAKEGEREGQREREQEKERDRESKRKRENERKDREAQRESKRRRETVSERSTLVKFLKFSDRRKDGKTQFFCELILNITTTICIFPSHIQKNSKLFRIEKSSLQTLFLQFFQNDLKIRLD